MRRASHFLSKPATGRVGDATNVASSASICEHKNTADERLFFEFADFYCLGDSKRVTSTLYCYVLREIGIASMVKTISPIALRFLSVLILTFWVGTALADKRVALIVGNSQYTRITPKLVNPANDAHDLAQALANIGFDVILRTDVGKGAFDQALVEFSRRAKNADTALFYYAGHGLQHNGKNYFLPTDIEVQDEFDFNYRAISQDSILYAVGQAKSVKIVVLDACRDNPLARQFIASRGWGGGGLARIDSAEETNIAYATAPDPVAQRRGRPQQSFHGSPH